MKDYLLEKMMSLSVMSVAMHLSGLEAEHFTLNSGCKVKWLYEEAKILQQTNQQTQPGSQSPALSSNSSSTESSGFNSWPSSDHSTPPGEDITTTADTLVNNNDIKLIHNGRDILDLGSHLRDTKWNLKFSQLPKDVHNFFNNRSQYSRVNDDYPPLHVDVPCEKCDFIESYY